MQGSKASRRHGTMENKLGLALQTGPEAEIGPCAACCQLNVSLKRGSTVLLSETADPSEVRKELGILETHCNLNSSVAVFLSQFLF